MSCPVRRICLVPVVQAHSERSRCRDDLSSLDHGQSLSDGCFKLNDLIDPNQFANSSGNFCKASKKLRGAVLRAFEVYQIEPLDHLIQNTSHASGYHPARFEAGGAFATTGVIKNEICMHELSARTRLPRDHLIKNNGLVAWTGLESERASAGKG